MAPAESIDSSAREMAGWILPHLGHGPQKPDGSEILRKRSIEELHQSVTLTGSSGSERNDVHELGYGLGWGSAGDRGVRVVSHGGAIDGFVASVMLLPDDDLGVAALMNQSCSALPGIACKTVADRILGRSDADWSAAALAKIAVAEGASEAAEVDKAKSRVADTKPSYPLKDYAGTYENPAFGGLTGFRIRFEPVPTAT